MSRYTVAVTIESSGDEETVNIVGGWAQGNQVIADSNPMRHLLALQKAVQTLAGPGGVALDGPPKIMAPPAGMRVT